MLLAMALTGWITGLLNTDCFFGGIGCVAKSRKHCPGSNQATQEADSNPNAHKPEPRTKTWRVDPFLRTDDVFTIGCEVACLAEERCGTRECPVKRLHGSHEVLGHGVCAAAGDLSLIVQLLIQTYTCDLAPIPGVWELR